MEENILTHKDLIIITNSYKCKEQHTIDEFQVFIPYVALDGEIGKKSERVGYCKECNCYFLNKTQIHNLQMDFAILCQVIDEKDYLKGTIDEIDVLAKCGYTVKKDRNINDTQRQVVLKSIIENGILSKEEVIARLDKQIAQKKTSKQFEDAVSKWELDKQFCMNM